MFHKISQLDVIFDTMFIWTFVNWGIGIINFGVTSIVFNFFILIIWILFCRLNSTRFFEVWQFLFFRHSNSRIQSRAKIMISLIRFNYLALILISHRHLFDKFLCFFLSILTNCPAPMFADLWVSIPSSWKSKQLRKVIPLKILFFSFSLKGWTLPLATRTFAVDLK